MVETPGILDQTRETRLAEAEGKGSRLPPFKHRSILVCLQCEGAATSLRPGSPCFGAGNCQETLAQRIHVAVWYIMGLPGVTTS